ncbi:TadE/TadG family type IV pilus assembly protein [Sphingobium sp. CR2-8]|uniref:TadE/TadG family type IV pilus assembly protein n=1 Tax=Sphingobium sp. CR2-8 TaxID=1306534 RepID=UPI002DB9ABD5|nr:TadE/TadG family type IV pilus assembly protein [Sphingobium sp. CR2-8]MEC3910892.1 TadE/TadG family type IV pilus assembly protein [Sphingobium sp. CR2-8]
MKRFTNWRRRLIKDRRGASIPEFALILLPLCLLILGGLDMGYQLYVRSVVLGAMERATRLATLQTVDNTAVETEIETTIKRIAPNATVNTTKGSFNAYSNINTMERLTKDTNGNNVLDSGDCWEDIDDNGARNVVVSGKAGSIGGADDIVRYETTVTYKRILPIWRIIGMGDTVTMTANTLTKRQPYEKQDPVVPKCKA